MLNYHNFIYTGHHSSITAIVQSLIYLFVQPIGNGSCSWFINDTKNIQARDGTSILSGLALGVVEVGRYRNYSIVDCLNEISQTLVSFKPKLILSPPHESYAK